MKKAIINGGIGSKVICAVTDDVTLEAAPIKGTDNGDGTASLLVTSSMAVLPDTTSGDLAAINSASASIDGKLPALVDGKIPVDASVSIDSVDIGDVDIKEFPAGNLGQQFKAASLSVAPATDIVDATYIGDIKFGEELPAGTQLIGKVGIDQSTPGTTNLVNVNGGTSQTEDIKITLDSESVAVTGPLTDAELRTSDVKVTLDSEKVAISAIDAGTNLIGKVGIDQTTPGTTNLVNVNGGASQTTDIKVTLDSESVAVTGPLTNAELTAQALATEATLGTMQADIALMRADLAAILAILES